MQSGANNNNSNKNHEYSFMFIRRFLHCLLLPASSFICQQYSYLYFSEYLMLTIDFLILLSEYPFSACLPCYFPLIFQDSAPG